VLRGGGGVAPFYSRHCAGSKRGTQVAAGGGGDGETRGAAERRWTWSECGWHGQRRYSDSVADERGPRGFLFFRIIQTGSNFKIENRYLNLLQIFPIFACR
jgi:hypothetical protein